MRLLIAVFASVGIAAQPIEAQLAVSRVTVIDVVQGRLLRDQLVFISEGRIARVEPARGASIPPGTRVIAGDGQFLIPGLWDMHAHYLGESTPGCPEITFALAIAHGVTGARNVAGHLDYLFAWRAEVEAARLVGPRILSSGPLIDGVPTAFPPASVVAPRPDDGRRIVDALWRRGVDFIKTYEMLDPETFFALVNQAKRRGLAVVAHLPLTVRADAASDSGVRSLEHLRNLELACSRDADSLLAERATLIERNARRNGRELRNEIHDAQRPRAIASYDSNRCRELLRRFAANSTWQTPTLFMETRDAFRPDLRDDVRNTLRWVPAQHQAVWRSWSQRTSALPPDVLLQRRRRADWIMQLVRQMRDERVGLLAGTDIGTEWTVPGAALHEELRALVDAGLTPLEALRSATLNAAMFFGKANDIGSVAPGRFADLVLLDADPLADIRNVARIAGVVANGRYFDRQELDSLLAGAERLARSGDHDVIHRPARASH